MIVFMVGEVFSQCMANVFLGFNDDRSEVYVKVDDGEIGWTHEGGKGIVLKYQ